MASENGKFKVGDRVLRVKESDSPDLFGEVGKEYTVLAASITGITVIEGKPAADHTAFALVPAWQPKVGDRVRSLVDWCNVKKGETYAVIALSTHGLWVAVPGETNHYMATREIEPAPDTLTIEAGKFYKDSVGSKVGPLKTWGLAKHYEDRLCEVEGDGRYWFLDGTGKGAPDLVALWEEPAKLTNLKAGDKVLALIDDLDVTKGGTYTVLSFDEEGNSVRIIDDEGDGWTLDEGEYEVVKEPASNDNAAVAKPKFKVGDRVRFKQSYGLVSVRGKEATVISTEGWGIKIYADGPGGGMSTESPESLELITTPTNPAIVALIENGTPRPSTSPKVHTSQEAATTEAERLALEHPGQQFGVFVLADSKIADLVMTPTAVLRAA